MRERGTQKPITLYGCVSESYDKIHKNDARAHARTLRARGYTQHEVLRVRARVALRRAPRPERIAGIIPSRYGRARLPYGPEDFKMQTGDTASGPWNDVYSSTVPSCASAGSCSHPYTWPAVRSPYWRLFVFNSQDGAARPKIMEVEFSVCS